MRKMYKKKCKNPECRKTFTGKSSQLYCCIECRASYRGKIEQPKMATLDDLQPGQGSLV